MIKIKRVEGKEEVSQQDLKLAEQKIFALQEKGYGALAIMYFLVEHNNFSVSLTGIDGGYAATIS